MGGTVKTILGGTGLDKYSIDWTNVKNIVIDNRNNDAFHNLCVLECC